MCVQASWKCKIQLQHLCFLYVKWRGEVKLSHHLNQSIQRIQNMVHKNTMLWSKHLVLSWLKAALSAGWKISKQTDRNKSQYTVSLSSYHGRHRGTWTFLCSRVINHLVNVRARLFVKHLYNVRQWLMPRQTQPKPNSCRWDVSLFWFTNAWEKYWISVYRRADYCSKCSIAVSILVLGLLSLNRVSIESNVIL